MNLAVLFLLPVLLSTGDRSEGLILLAITPQLYDSCKLDTDANGRGSYFTQRLDEAGYIHPGNFGTDTHK